MADPLTLIRRARPAVRGDHPQHQAAGLWPGSGALPRDRRPADQHVPSASFPAARWISCRCPAQLGASRVGGIDVNKPRIRAALAAVLALALSPGGFTAADMTAKIHAMTGQAHATCNTRQAAYDLRKLRGKQLISKPARTRRYYLPGPGRPDHIGAAHPPGPRHRPDPGRRPDPPALPRPGQADPRRPGLRTSPNRHGRPVQAPGHPARLSRGMASAKPNFWRSWNLKRLTAARAVPQPFSRRYGVGAADIMTFTTLAGRRGARSGPPGGSRQATRPRPPARRRPASARFTLTVPS